MHPSVSAGLLPVFAASGFVAGWFLVLLYNRLPEGWLQDYGFRPNDPDWPPARRIRDIRAHVLIAGLTAIGFTLLGSATGLTPRTLILVLAFCALLLAALPDLLNRIIPDQAVIVLALAGAALTADDLARGSGVQIVVIDRLGGAVAAGGILFLIGWLASVLLHREAMGMGDVKLLFSCGLLTGLRLVPLLYLATFVTAAIVFLPLSLRRKPAPDGEEAPDETSRQIPLGPFIATACFLCLVAGDALSRLLFPYLTLL